MVKREPHITGCVLPPAYGRTIAIRADPRSRSSPERHHRLKGSLGTATWKGESLERWQYEVTGGGRIWYVIDDARRSAWITYAGTGHPKATD